MIGPSVLLPSCSVATSASGPPLRVVGARAPSPRRALASGRLGRGALLLRRLRGRAGEHLGEVARGVRLFARHDGFGSPRRHDRPALVAALGPEIDHPVGACDDIEVVLDDDDRVALIAEL